MALACLLMACTDKDQGTVSDAVTSAQAKADSALAGARAGAQGAVDQADSALRGETSAAAGGTTPAPAGGGAATTDTGMTKGADAPSMQLNLSSDQVQELQAALNDAGCDAGPVDGVVGAQTRAGITCGLQKHNISDQDMPALYRALNLNFGG